jgi:tRNA A37 methylthiotransferase MiaB
VAQVKQRSRQTFALLNKIALENNEKWIGWKGEVLFNEQTDDAVRGRNFAYKSVFVDEPVMVGQKKQVRISRATSHGLYGTITS